MQVRLSHCAVATRPVDAPVLRDRHAGAEGLWQGHRDSVRHLGLLWVCTL